jgi:hypothetical protein
MATKQTGNILRQIDQLFGAGTVAGLSDAQLLRRFRARRDEAAFVALVTRHGPMGIGNLFQDVMVAPGEVKELGDLKVVPRKEDPS